MHAHVCKGECVSVCAWVCSGVCVWGGKESLPKHSVLKSREQPGNELDFNPVTTGDYK